VEPSTKRERFDRAFETLLHAFRGEAIPSDGANGTAVRLNVLPIQKPHPPLWIAVQRREALPFVARKGVNLALVPYATVADLKELKDEITEFRNALPKGPSAQVAVALHLYAGPAVDRARSALQRYLDQRLVTQSAFYQDKVRRDPRHASAETIEKSGFALFGPPTEVAERLDAFRNVGVDEILGIFDFGGMPVEDVASSVSELGRRFHG
jgi:alkanesulfonate monooxygenase SsuD/methylene tetrahydromethanopterin reductase-like flavin-dependent oxidoreductase (luciferase family)